MEEIFYIIFVVVLIAVVVALLTKNKYIRRKSKSYNPYEIDIKQIDRMKDGSEFEIYLYVLLNELGYRDTYKTTGSRDFGADLVFTDSNKERNVIQAKRYSVKNLVGLSAVQQIYTSLRYYKAKKAIVITTSKYTDSCEKLAGVNGVKLIDRTDLINIIRCLKKGDKMKARQIIESEPRVIYDAWSSYKDSKPIIKKDYKVDVEYSKMAK